MTLEVGKLAILKDLGGSNDLGWGAWVFGLGRSG